MRSFGDGVKGPILLTPSDIGVLTIQILLAKEARDIGEGPTHFDRSNARDTLEAGQDLDPLNKGVS